MADPFVKGRWIIFVSLLLAMALVLVPLPASAPFELNYLRPDWIALVLIYWILAVPEKVGVPAAFLLSLITDLVVGTPFGFHGLSFVILAALAKSSYQQVRMLEIWQQSILIAMALMIVSGIQLLMMTLMLDRSSNLLQFMKPITSALFWPWVFLMLRFCRRRYL
ncbi:rod shape-determining protein MreD [Pseudomonadales bacterium]|jgi:rod shape-determining protein MreD|nr:rod shape-determining protein MreD [Pseudomonadales bacterium]MDA8627723.1 rod shape-determining protein MreD [Pseudomonadales bacterium]